MGSIVHVHLGGQLAEVERANLTLARTRADVDAGAAVLGPASLVGGGALLLLGKRS